MSGIMKNKTPRKLSRISFGKIQVYIIYICLEKSEAITAQKMIWLFPLRISSIKLHVLSRECLLLRPRELFTSASPKIYKRSSKAAWINLAMLKIKKLVSSKQF